MNDSQKLEIADLAIKYVEAQDALRAIDQNIFMRNTPGVKTYQYRLETQRIRNSRSLARANEVVAYNALWEKINERPQRTRVENGVCSECCGNGGYLVEFGGEVVRHGSCPKCGKGLPD